jgi:hypothetical protein
MVGIGSGLSFITAMSTNGQNFNAAIRGRVLGMLSAGFAFSSSLISFLYAQILSDVSLTVFFLVMGGIVSILFCLGGCYVRVIPATVAVSTVSVTESGEAMTEAESEPIEAPGSRLIHSISNSTSPTAIDDWKNRPSSLWGALVKVVADRKFWELYVLCAVGAGGGLFVLNNLGSMQESLSGEQDMDLLQQLVVVLAVGKLFLNVQLSKVFHHVDINICFDSVDKLRGSHCRCLCFRHCPLSSDIPSICLLDGHVDLPLRLLHIFQPQLSLHHCFLGRFCVWRRLGHGANVGQRTIWNDQLWKDYGVHRHSARYCQPCV